MFRLPCVMTLHNVVQLVWVPNSLCHGTEWSGVLLNPFVPPRMKIADECGTATVDSTHIAHANSAHTVVAACQYLFLLYVPLLNAITTI